MQLRNQMKMDKRADMKILGIAILIIAVVVFLPLVSAEWTEGMNVGLFSAYWMNDSTDEIGNYDLTDDSTGNGYDMEETSDVLTGAEDAYATLNLEVFVNEN